MRLTTLLPPDIGPTDAVGRARTATAGVLLLASGLYFAAEVVVASRWPQPYSWSENMISDLGVPECLGDLGRYGGWSDRFICSPWHPLMNTTFVLVGAAGIGAAVLLAPRFPRPWRHLLVALATANGLAMAAVGLFPGSASEFPGGPLIRTIVHPVAAYGEHITGMALMIVVAAAARRNRVLLAWTALLFGISGIAALVILGTAPLGTGGTERAAIDPFLLWRVTLGAGVLGAAVLGNRMTRGTGPSDTDRDDERRSLR